MQIRSYLFLYILYLLYRYNKQCIFPGCFPVAIIWIRVLNVCIMYCVCARVCVSQNAEVVTFECSQLIAMCYKVKKLNKSVKY